MTPSDPHSTPRDLLPRERDEHPFAPFVRILGKGKKGSRSLTMAEAEQAMGMVLRGETLDLQLGAFLMLLRVKEETAEELAGFVKAAKAVFSIPPLPRVDIDWSSYAGKRRHLPWFLLALRVLAASGRRIFIHGAEGHTAGRIYTRDMAVQAGVPVCSNWEEVAAALHTQNIAYLPLACLNRRLADIIQMRSLLGLRSPVHSMARLLNPLNAPLVMQGIFHPPYAPLHQDTGALLEYPTTLVIKGEGGEIERNPDAPCRLHLAVGGRKTIEEWPALSTQRHLRGEDLSGDHLARVWSGETQDPYATQAIIGTLAVVLRGLDQRSSTSDLHGEAERMWRER